MTNQTRTRNRIAALSALAAVSLGAVLIFSAGCEKKKPPPPPPPPPPAKKVEAPPAEPVNVDALLQELKADPRVKFASGTAPADRSLAEAVIRFAGAFAAGDSNAAKTLMTTDTRAILDELVASGGWTEATGPGRIEAVRVVTLSNTTVANPESSKVGFAIQSPTEAYLIAWTAARAGGDNWVFTKLDCQDDVRRRAADFDGVALTSGFNLAAASMGDLVGDESSSAPGEKQEGGGAAEEEKSGPRQKQTPAGPITIPGGG